MKFKAGEKVKIIGGRSYLGKKFWGKIAIIINGKPAETIAGAEIYEINLGSGGVWGHELEKLNSNIWKGKNV